MPQVFNPGEGETRPLDPDAIVYTTAQKVADLLDIGPQEAVLMSANAEANAVLVTGSDYRAIGFSVGDTILIYSDTDPMGLERVITSITTSTGGVKLTFSSAINPGLYETTDNGYVQNQASFSNGRTRGLTKTKVETIIKRMQDKIDNETHNAWRPYLVSAEYINFDTYKPYRRRYYTDYVGTTPLLFRNVQQLLRLELWQGDDYREIGAAEARIRIPDSVQGVTGSIVMSPGNGSAATLTIGTGTNQWRSDFDKVTTAQNLADLINKENRVSKAAIDFIPTFTLEGNTANVALHNEFYASANSDYGTGIVKVTSMRGTKGGETCSLVSTVPGVSISQTSSSKTTFNSYDGNQTITVTSTGNNNGSVTSFQSLIAGTGYTGSANGVVTSGGSGSGLIVNTTVSGGSITGIVVASPGASYTVGDVITISGGTSTFTVSNVSSGGFVDAGVVTDGTRVFSYTGKTSTTFTGCVAVIGALADVAGSLSQHQPKIDLQGGSASGDQGRLRDWWIDHEMGIIYFNNSYPFFEWNAIKTSYIYGERYLEQAIEDACTKLVAIDLLMSDDRSVLIPEGSQNVDLASKIQLYKADVDKTMARYKEVVLFG